MVSIQRFGFSLFMMQLFRTILYEHSAHNVYFWGAWCSLECRNCWLRYWFGTKHPWYVFQYKVQPNLILELCFLSLLRRFQPGALSGTEYRHSQVTWDSGLLCFVPGTPQALAQSCLSFGAFSFVLEYMNKTRPAIAATASSEPSSQPQININNHLHLHLNLPVLPPFTLPPLAFAGPLSFLNQEFGGRAKPL
jgi:hypothetical protein